MKMPSGGALTLTHAHRRVDEVAHARKENAGNKRLNHQDHDAAGNRELLSSDAKLVRSEINKAIEIFIRAGVNVSGAVQMGGLTLRDHSV